MSPRGSRRFGMPNLARWLSGRSRSTAFADALSWPSRPLIDLEHEIIVLFSPKSACTSTLIWYYWVTGQYDAARRHGSWPHRFRTDCYEHSDVFARAVALGPRAFRVLRVIRDPWSRALSSFRHALATGYADKALARLIGLEFGATRQMNLLTFLQFLEASDLRRCDSHHALQRHPLEDLLRPSWTINVSREPLYERLNDIERELGLDETLFDELAWLKDIHRLRDFDHRRVEMANAASVVFDERAARLGPWPTDASFLTPDIRTRIGTLYQIDVRSYC